MKTMVDWLLAQRFRPVVFAVAFAPLLPVVTAALMVLESAARGPNQALAGAGLGIVAVWVLAVVTDSSFWLLVAPAIVSLLVGVAIGGLLRWARAMGLAFQATVLGCFGTTLLVVAFGPSSAELFAPAAEYLIEMLESASAPEAQIELVRGLQPIMLGLTAAGAFVQLVAAMLLGCWWLALARDESSFGVEFRSLRLGRVLGVPGMVLVAAGFFWDAPWIQNLTPIAMCAFLFQGAAVMHAWAHAKQWHVGAIVPVYVLLVTPFMAIPMLGLSAAGLLDNIFDLRAPLRARS
jgi:hypothetical protein